MEMKGGKFLVTGGYGLLGSHIADQLLSAGASKVVLFDNGSIGSQGSIADLLQDSRVQPLRGDILRINDLYDALEGIDGVFHTAFFITRPLSENVWTGMDVNIRGIMNVLQACVWRTVSKVIYSSSISTYGSHSEGSITEDMPFRGQGVAPASALYGAGKLMSEHLCAFFRERHGLDYAALRVSSVYGERQHGRGMNIQPILDAHECIERDEPIAIRADPEEVHDYIYAGDAARAHVLAMASDISGEALNIASGVPVTYAELIQAVQTACQSHLPAHFEDDPKRLKSARVSKNSFSIAKARELIGWQPEVDLVQGITKLLNWRRSHTPT